MNTAVVERASRIQISFKRFVSAAASPRLRPSLVAIKQTASSAHHPEWLTQQAVNCLQRARSRKQPVFVYYAPTLPHAPFSLPDSLVNTNVSITPAGLVEPDPSWAIERKQLLNQLTSKGHVCASHITRCNPAAATPCEEQYVFREGEERRSSACSPLVSSAIALSKDRWIDPSWLLAKENCEQRRLAHLFAAGLAWIDIGVGKLLKSLHPKQSMVILTSDHGASFLGKGSPYEAGIRVPLIVRWGGGRMPTVGTAIDTMATHLDVLPTIIDAAQLDASRYKHLEGRSLLPALRGATATDEERPLFIEIGYARAVRHHNWKLIVVNDIYDRCSDAAVTTTCRNFHGQRIDKHGAGAMRFGLGNMTYDAAARHPAFCHRRQLYDLSSDPLEATNLAASRPDKYRSFCGFSSTT